MVLYYDEVWHWLDEYGESEVGASIHTKYDNNIEPTEKGTLLIFRVYYEKHADYKIHHLKLINDLIDSGLKVFGVQQNLTKVVFHREQDSYERDSGIRHRHEKFTWINMD